MNRLIIAMLLVAACDADTAGEPTAPDVSSDDVVQAPLPVIQLNPASPTSRDEITAVVDGGAVEGAAVEIVWLAPGKEPILGATLAAGLTARGETWTITARRVLATGLGPAGEISVTIRNAAPRCLRAEIEVGTTGAVGCVCAERDEPDDDPALDHCTFEIDGGDPIEADACVLEGATGGQEIVCHLVPNDGEADGPTITTDALVYGNGPPSGGQVAVTPAQPTEADTVTCVASGAVDPDGDPVQWRYRWLRGEAVIAEDVAAITGNLFDKGDAVRCEATPSDGVLQGPAVLSAPVVAVNTPPTAALAEVSPLSAPRTGTFSCVAGGLADVDPADTPAALVTWWVDDQAAGEGDALDAAGLAVGAEVRCQVTPDDGEQAGEPVTSEPATVINLAPVVSGVTVTPPNPGALATLACDPVGLTDPEGDPLTVSRIWRRNGSVLIGQTGATLAGVFAAGDVIDCALTASDPWSSAPEVASAPVTVLNTPPAVGTVTLSPLAPSPCAVLTCAAGGLTDPDGTQGLTVAWRWLVGGAPITHTAATLAAPAPHSSVQCFAQVADPAGALSAEVPSGVVTVTNLAPSVGGAAIVPSEPVIGDVLTCAATDVADPDCGEAEVAFVWKRGAQVLGQGPTLSTAGLTVGDVTCQATASDGHDAAVASASVWLDEPPPAAPLVSLSLAGGGATCVPQTPAPEATVTWWLGSGAPFQGGFSLPSGAVSDCDRVRCRLTMPGGDLSNTAEIIAPVGPMCDDGNACTAASCGAQGGCVNAPAAGPCDDGSVCTTGDACAGGQCKGQPVTCDDGNPCTEGICAPGFGCSFGHQAGPCSDGSVCTAGDACQQGSCKPGAPIACNDGNACTADTCDPVAGCLATPTSGACDDQNPCTQGDSCGGGQCAGTPVAGKPACTGSGGPGYCGGGVCQPNQPPAPPAVSVSPAAPVTGQALTCEATGAADPDGWPGTVTMVYSWRKGATPIAGETGATLPGAQVQKGASITCVVTATDTVSASAPASATVVVGNAPPAIAGVTVQAAAGGSPQAGGALRCVAAASDPDAGDILTTTAAWWVDDVATAGTGDTLPAGKFCPCQRVRCQATVSDGAKSAQAGSAEAVIPASAACGANPCLTWSCAPGGGCQGAPKSGACDDGDPCTVNGTCQGGACVSQPVPGDFCDTGNPCRDEACVSGQGCVSTDKTGPCDDGSLCTTGDTCVAGNCVGEPLDCSDGLACTSDACLPQSGCADTLPPGSQTFPVTVVALQKPYAPLADEGPAQIVVGTQGGRHVWTSLMLDLPPAVTWDPAKAWIRVIARSPCCSGSLYSDTTAQAHQLLKQANGDYLAPHVLWFLTDAGVTAKAGDKVCLTLEIKIHNQSTSGYLITTSHRHVVTLTN